MNLIQFVNKYDEAVEQGDVVVIDRKQARLLRGPQGEICPEVDLTATAYDPRACGVVAALYAEVRFEEVEAEREQAGEESPEGEGEAGASGAKKGKRASKADKSAKINKPDNAAAPDSQRFTPEEFESLDRTRVGPGQRGFMVVLGVYDHCKIDADIAPIEVGDLLTTSPTRGHAQKVLDPTKATGAVIGKALGELKKGKGKIPILVTLQ
jgi:hypothetical protein